MRKTAITCAVALLVATPALAQEWTEYKSARDGRNVRELVPLRYAAAQ